MPRSFRWTPQRRASEHHLSRLRARGKPEWRGCSLSQVLHQTRAMRTGSHAFGVATELSDFDYLAVFQPKLGAMERNGWRQIESYGAGSDWFIWQRWNVHLMWSPLDGQMVAWLMAHRHCVIERPVDKARRKRIFDHYMKGFPLL